MHSFFLLSLAGLLATPPAADWLVVPGHSLGHVVLGADAATLAALGKPTTGDAAMQKAWTTWLGSRPASGSAPSQLDVYTAPQNNDVDHHTVQLVRATSPWFHLANGLRPGSSLRTIRAVYGALPLAATYQLPTGRRYLYDDVRRGIAFETDGTAATSHCRAVVVHQAGQAVATAGLPLGAYLAQKMPAQ